MWRQKACNYDSWIISSRVRQEDWRGGFLTLLMRVVLCSACLPSWEWSCWTSTSLSVSVSVSSGFSRSCMSTSSAARHECHTSSSSHTRWAHTHNHMSWFSQDILQQVDITTENTPNITVIHYGSNGNLRNTRTKLKSFQINQCTNNFPRPPSLKESDGLETALRSSYKFFMINPKTQLITARNCKNVTYRQIFRFPTVFEPAVNTSVRESNQI